MPGCSRITIIDRPDQVHLTLLDCSHQRIDHRFAKQRLVAQDNQRPGRCRPAAAEFLKAKPETHREPFLWRAVGDRDETSGAPELLRASVPGSVHDDAAGEGPSLEQPSDHLEHVRQDRLPVEPSVQLVPPEPACLACGEDNAESGWT